MTGQHFTFTFDTTSLKMFETFMHTLFYGNFLHGIVNKKSLSSDAVNSTRMLLQQ